MTGYFSPVKGGVENHCYNLAKELMRRNLKVEIHTSKHTFIQFGVLKDYEIIGGIKVFRHKDFWKFVPKDCDIIHLHNFTIFPHFFIFLKILIKKLFKMRAPRLVITLHGGLTIWWKEFSFFGKTIKAYHKTLGKFFLNHVADKIIAVSEWEKEQLVKEGVNIKKIAVIPNGVEDLAYTLPKVKNSDLEKHKPYLLFLGRISRIKNLEFVIKCLKKIADVEFLIAGPIHEKKYYEGLTHIISELGLANRVLFVGEVEGKFKYKLIDNALAVVLTSHHEGEGIAVKEAMARGKPVIVSNIEPLNLLVKNGENGFVVSNEEEFVDAVKKLMNKNIVDKIFKNNITKTREWRWEATGAKIAYIYTTLFK